MASGKNRTKLPPALKSLYRKRVKMGNLIRRGPEFELGSFVAEALKFNKL